MKYTPSQIWFNFLHSNYLIYNISWEDSLVDRQLLKLDHESELLTITSAGCNILDYALEKPKSIDSVDINSKQTALFDLKRVLIEHGDYVLFSDFFAKGKVTDYKSVYSTIRDSLKPESQVFWDRKISYFDPSGRGLFYQGGAGMFARYLNYILKKKNIANEVSELIRSENIEEREQVFKFISGKLWEGPERYIWKTNGVLSLAGIPRTQRDSIGDINSFMKKVLEKVFVHQSARNNPYWRVYLEGAYQPECYPDYLKKKNFEILRDHLKVISSSTKSIYNHLLDIDKRYSHFHLLDHMDWLAGHNNEILSKQWDLIIKRADSKAKVLFRTAHNDINFIPGFVKETFDFEKVSTSFINKSDRVGTYSGTYLGTLR